MAQEVIEKLEEQLNCSICLDTYTNPKLLQCFHVYCQGCLVRLVVRDLQGQDSITCPNCRQVTPINSKKGARGLQPAFHINRLLEIQESVKKIQELPVKQEAASSSEQAPLVSITNIQCCSEHVSEELKLFCSTCNDLICFECAIKGGSHHDHDYEPIKNAFEAFQGEIFASLKPLEDQLAVVNKALTELDGVCASVSDQCMTVEADIHSKVRKLHEFIDARKTELIQELHTSTQTKLKNLAAQRDQIETLQARLSSCLEFISRRLADDNQGDVLLMKSSMNKQVDELASTFQPDKLKPAADALSKLTFSLPMEVTRMCEGFGKLEQIEVELAMGCVSKKRFEGRSKSASGFLSGEQRHWKKVSDIPVYVGRPISWKEDAGSATHLWEEVDSKEPCHLGGTEYCEQVMKTVQLKKQKLRCSACKILVHSTCVKQLYYEGFSCKHSFNEVGMSTSVHHHFLQRRKLDGKCLKCSGNWKKRDVTGMSCSWCGDAYHLECFNHLPHLRQESCHLGPLKNLIIPPSWILKYPPTEQPEQKVRLSSDPGSSMRKQDRADEPTSKCFTVQPLFTSRQQKPLLVFIDPESNKKQGLKTLQTLQGLLNPRQVFDLTQDRPEFGLKLFQNVSNLRILCCGNDETVGLLLSTLNHLGIRPSPPVAVLPMGGRNDLSRALGWEAMYGDEPIEKFLLYVEEGPAQQLDGWQINSWPNPQAASFERPDALTLVYELQRSMFAVFCVGVDAYRLLELQYEQEESGPEKFRGKSRKLGKNPTKDLAQNLQIYGDGVKLDIGSLRPDTVCFLNIPSYNGINIWGNPSPGFTEQLIDDGKIEIIVFSASAFSKLGSGVKIAQCEHVKMELLSPCPVHIDGCPFFVASSVIELGVSSKAAMIRKVPRQSVQPSPQQTVVPQMREWHLTELQEGLLDAVKRGNLNKVKDIHQKGADLMQSDHNGWTPLHHASRLDKREIVQYIVHNIPPEALDMVEDERLQTALHKAAWYGDFEVCRILVENGASVNRQDYQGKNAYDKAMQSGNHELQAYIKAKLDEATSLKEISK